MSITQEILKETLTKDEIFGGVRIEANMTQLYSVEDLKDLVNLNTVVHLNFAVNILQELEPFLHQCANLRILDFSINHIGEIKNLESCANLVHIDLSKNQIQSIGTGLRNLPRLTHIGTCIHS